MLKIISNTTPIICLLKIGKLNLLQKIYEQNIIPEAVFQEIEAGKNKSYYVDLQALSFIKIQKIQNSSVLNFLTDLDKSEADLLLWQKKLMQI